MIAQLCGDEIGSIRQRMNRTGIGFAGIEGAWWLPAAEPFTLPCHVADDLARIGAAIFALFDVVTELYGAPESAACGLDRLLEHKVPADIPRLMAPGRVLAVRPDFQLCLAENGEHLRLVATELEICPSAQGFAHAMQVGYGLTTDLVDAFARMLGGRELLIVCSGQWSEFLFDQLAFCRALAAAGARARVLCDTPIAMIDASARSGAIWRPPMFGVRERPARWDVELGRRIRDHGFEPYLWPDAAGWPDQVGDALVFRFGYFDCFSAELLQRLLRWQAAGATFLNPTQFILDSKVVMAALGLPAVRRRIQAYDANALAALDGCIPETLLVQPGIMARLRREQSEWVIKYAGFDRGNQAWGGRSLQVGALHTADSWAQILRSSLELPWPVVAQRFMPTARLDIAYLDGQDTPRQMRQGATRLRAFVLRDEPSLPLSPASERLRNQRYLPLSPASERLRNQRYLPLSPASERGPGGEGVTVCGAHLTASGGAVQVSESTDAVQAPVVFRD
jgi:hypothetical protein